VHLSYKGKVVAARETAVTIPMFKGGPATNSNELIEHIKRAVLGKASSFISNTEILGENVMEMSFKTAGRVVMATSMTGAATGSITGVVASDGIRGAIALGKSDRGASDGDSYRFGDFTRGTIRSIKQASSSGGQTRRDDSKGYSVGDFSVGASRALGAYAGENKSRLAGAGLSGVGMVVGGVVAGPLGLIAGSYLGGRAGKKTFEDKAPSKDGKWRAAFGKCPLQYCWNPFFSQFSLALPRDFQRRHARSSGYGVSLATST
jgi:hypothetical protein